MAVLKALRHLPLAQAEGPRKDAARICHGTRVPPGGGLGSNYPMFPSKRAWNGVGMCSSVGNPAYEEFLELLQDRMVFRIPLRKNQRS